MRCFFFLVKDSFTGILLNTFEDFTQDLRAFFKAFFLLLWVILLILGNYLHNFFRQGAPFKFGTDSTQKIRYLDDLRILSLFIFGGTTICQTLAARYDFSDCCSVFNLYFI